jgi:hypothetical protein
MQNSFTKIDAKPIQARSQCGGHGSSIQHRPSQRVPAVAGTSRVEEMIRGIALA